MPVVKYHMSDRVYLSTNKGVRMHEILPGKYAEKRASVCLQILIPGLTVDKLVSACILVNAYTTYPCLILVIQVSTVCRYSSEHPYLLKNFRT